MQRILLVLTIIYLLIKRATDRKRMQSLTYQIISIITSKNKDIHGRSVIRDADASKRNTLPVMVRTEEGQSAA